MNIANISYTKNHLSRLLERVRAGETITIVDRDRPVARLTPALAGDLDSRLLDLARRGLVRLPERALDQKALARLPRPRLRRGADAVRAVTAEREEGWVKYWDTSAIVPLLVEQAATEPLLHLAAGDAAMITAWATELECISTLCRLQREGALTATATAQSMQRLQEYTSAWREVQPGASLRAAARRLLQTHPLRAADAVQLGAAWVASDGDPSALTVVCLDQRLAAAARTEGFAVLP